MIFHYILIALQKQYFNIFDWWIGKFPGIPETNHVEATQTTCTLDAQCSYKQLL